MDGVFDFVLGVYGRARAVIGEGLDQLWTSFNYGSIFDELGPIRSTIEEMSRSGRRKRLVLRMAVFGVGQVGHEEEELLLF